jgi:antitoxin HicB
MRQDLSVYLSLHLPMTFIKETSGFTVLIKDLPACISVGETLEEAWVMIEDVKRAWLGSALKHGDVIPEPSPF